MYNSLTKKQPFYTEVPGRAIFLALLLCITSCDNIHFSNDKKGESVSEKDKPLDFNSEQEKESQATPGEATPGEETQDSDGNPDEQLKEEKEATWDQEILSDGCSLNYPVADPVEEAEFIKQLDGHWLEDEIRGSFASGFEIQF